MIVIDLTDLARVTGGEATEDNLGRCGPGDDLAFLGDVRTPECLAHDLAVLGGDPNGQPSFCSHVASLALLRAGRRFNTHDACQCVSGGGGSPTDGT